MSFHIQVNIISAYSITSQLIKKLEKDLVFNDVGSGIWKIVYTSIFNTPCYAPLFYC